MTSMNEQIGTGMLHRAYALATTVAAPLIAAGLLIFKRGRTRFRERLGSWGAISGTPWWFHGASVGEVQGLSSILRLLKQDKPSEQVLLTCTSPTGIERGVGLADFTRLIPIDAPCLVRRALRAVNPKQFVIAETELWPELMRQALLRKIPISIVNGRISDYTESWYFRLHSLFWPLVSQCRLICVPDQQQRERFVSLGAAPERVHVTGHTKYDTTPKFAAHDARQSCRAALFSGLSDRSRILVLGSLRPGEESYWFDACAAAWTAGQDLRLVVVPRHQEKFSFFAARLADYAIDFCRKSQLAAGEPATGKALLVDTMGELEGCYAAADLAFIGATLVDVGGHNPLEPAMYGVPVVVGPYISVIRGIVEELRGTQGVVEVSTSEQVSNVIARLFSSSDDLVQVGAQGKLVWQRHLGSAQRVLRLLEGA